MIAANGTIMKLIAELNKSQKALIGNCLSSSLTPQGRPIIELIYKKSSGNITGRDGRQLIESIAEINRSAIRVRRDSIGWYRN